MCLKMQSGGFNLNNSCRRIYPEERAPVAQWMTADWTPQSV